MSKMYEKDNCFADASANKAGPAALAETELLREILTRISSIRKNVKESELYWDSRSAKEQRTAFLDDSDFIEDVENNIYIHIKNLSAIAEVKVESVSSDEVKKSLCDDIFG